jgi:hypothetical protein
MSTASGLLNDLAERLGRRSSRREIASSCGPGKSPFPPRLLPESGRPKLTSWQHWRAVGAVPIPWTMRRRGTTSGLRSTGQGIGPLSLVSLSGWTSIPLHPRQGAARGVGKLKCRVPWFCPLGPSRERIPGSTPSAGPIGIARGGLRLPRRSQRWA